MNGLLFFVRTSFLLVLICLFLAVGGRANAHEKNSKSFMDLPVTRDLRPKFVLFSWRGSAGGSQFALISKINGNEDHRFIDNFHSGRTRGMDIAALRAALAKLPRRCLLTWMKDGPHKLDYADSRSVQEIKQLANKLRIDLQFNEMTYESPDV